MKIKLAALAMLAAVFVSACGSSAKTYYYTLQTSAASDVAAKPQPYRIAITALSLPEIVDRPQIVLRSGDTQVLISDNHLWGQPLKSEIARNLAAHLTRETGATRVILPGQTGYDDAEIKIAIDILRFDSVANADATIEANWSVRRKGVDQPLNGHTLVREAANGAGYDALIAAHSRALARLSHAIAEMLKP